MAGKRAVWVAVVVAAVMGGKGAQAQRAGAADLPAATRPAAGGAATRAGAGGAVAADYSSPRAAVASFLRASDEAGLREALVIAPESRREVEAFLGPMIATLALQKAAQAQFGAPAAQYFSKQTDAWIARRAQDVENAPLDVQGDNAAILHLPANEELKHAGADIELHRVNGQWKIDAASMFKVRNTPPATLAARVQLAEAITAETRQMIKDMPKFLSAGDAFQEWWKRSVEAQQRIVRQAATRPEGR